MRGDARVLLEPLKRLVGLQCVAPGQVIVGDIGQLGEDREGADQDQHIGHVQALQPLRQGLIRLAIAMVANRVAADVFDPFEAAGPVLVADHLAQQPPEQADAGPAGGGRRAARPRIGLRPGQGGHGVEVP